MQQENKIRPRQIAEIAVAMEIVPFAFVKKGVLCAKGSLQRSQCQIFFLSQGEDGFPGFKGDMGIKGDRVRNLFSG